MPDPAASIVAVLLRPIAGLAEIEPLRVYINDWRESRRRLGRRLPSQRPFGLSLDEEIPSILTAALIAMGLMSTSPSLAQDVGVPASSSSSRSPVDDPGSSAPTLSSPPPSPRERRGLPSPWSSPPFPGSEFTGPTIGAPVSDYDYFLKSLWKDTALGRALSDSRIDVYGWANVGWNWSTSRDSNTPNSYDLVPNQVLLNQLVLRVERQLDTVQTSHDDWGFRVSNVFGTDYRYTVAKGWFDHQLLKENQLYGFDMPELYFQYYTPTVAEGLVLRVGRIISPPDIEAQLAPDNYLYSHSTMFSVDPYTFTGVFATVRLDPQWQVQAGVHAGSDNAPWTDSASPNAHLMARWTSADNSDSIWAGINSLGEGKYRDGKDNLQQVVGTWSHRFSDRVHMATELYYMWQRDALRGGTVNDGPVRRFGGGGGPGDLIPGVSDSFGAVNYLQFQIDDVSYVSIRNDFLADYKGQRTGYRNDYSSHTIGYSRNLTPWATVRPEIKYERGYSTPAYDLGRKSDQWKFAVDLIIRF